MPFTYNVRETPEGKYIEIENFTSGTDVLSVPEVIDGLSVRRIASHAFEGRSDLVEVHLPDSVRELGSFAFHNIKSLRKVIMYDSVQDYAHGVLRHCAHLEEIILYSRGRDFSLLKQVLGAHEESLTATLHLPDGVTRLSFPDFALIASENTMARTIQFAYEGGGYAYRECIRKREIRFREYDRLFPFMVHDDPGYAAQIAADRLMYPTSLDAPAKEQYTAFLREHDCDALCRFAKNRDKERAAWMTGLKIAGPRAIDEALKIASSMHETELCAIMMEQGRPVSNETVERGARTGAMELEDW